MDEWESNTGLSREEFEKFTRYCNGSDNRIDNRNRAVILGLTAPGVLVAPGADIRLGENGRVGSGCFIGLYTYLNGDVVVGENVLIGPHCSITSNNHIFETKTRAFSGNRGAPIRIGDGCWLASGCMVTAGVTLGRANLVCANAVVTKSTPDYAIMAGTPARKVGEINPETGEYHWYERDDR